MTTFAQCCRQLCEGLCGAGVGRAAGGGCIVDGRKFSGDAVDGSRPAAFGVNDTALSSRNCCVASLRGLGRRDTAFGSVSTALGASKVLVRRTTCLVWKGGGNWRRSSGMSGL